jgi:hypothetical protein
LGLVFFRKNFKGDILLHMLDRLSGGRNIREKICVMDYLVFQINYTIFQKALTVFNQFIDQDDEVIDYYCGGGSIGLPLSTKNAVCCL